MHISINKFIFIDCRSKINSIKSEIFDGVNGNFDEINLIFFSLNGNHVLFMKNVVACLSLSYYMGKS